MPINSFVVWKDRILFMISYSVGTYNNKDSFSIMFQTQQHDEIYYLISRNNLTRIKLIQTYKNKVVYKNKFKHIFFKNI